MATKTKTKIKKYKKAATTNGFQIESPKLLNAVESDFPYVFRTSPLSKRKWTGTET